MCNSSKVYIYNSTHQELLEINPKLNMHSIKLSNQRNSSNSQIFFKLNSEPLHAMKILKKFINFSKLKENWESNSPLRRKHNTARKKLRRKKWAPKGLMEKTSRIQLIFGSLRLISAWKKREKLFSKLGWGLL